jgi:pseudouridine synthase
LIAADSEQKDSQRGDSNPDDVSEQLRAEESSAPGSAPPRRVRLNRYLALSAVASRRGGDRLIAEGRVAVNGTIVAEAGTLVLPGRDRVEVDGTPVSPRAERLYWMLHKPRGVVTTLKDPQGRRSVRDLLDRSAAAGVFPVGRLDLDSEGLLLLTNDGDLAHRLLHPRYHVRKRYRVWTSPAPRAADLEQLAAGVAIEPGLGTRPAAVFPVPADAAADPASPPSFEIEIAEGKKRQIRRMCEVLGLRVTRLVRTHFGPLALGALDPGSIRALTPDEVQALEAAAGLPTRKRRRS